MSDPSPFADPWRVRCPVGHTAITRRRGHSKRAARLGAAWWYCGTCKTRYEYVVDHKTGEELPA